MREIRTSGLMSGVGKRGGALRQCSRPTSTLPTWRGEVREKTDYHQAMDPVVALVFGLVYLGMLLGEIPGLTLE